MITPSAKARAAGLLFLISIAAALCAEFVLHGAFRVAALTVAAAGYIAVTVLFYALFKRQDSAGALLIAWLCALVIALGGLGERPVARDAALLFFAIYCIALGFMIVMSTFLPDFLGALVAFSGVIWLTMLPHRVARDLYPFNFVAGITCLLTLCVWLLVRGVDVQSS